MTLALTRRRLLAVAAAGGCAGLLPALPRHALAGPGATQLTVDRRTLEVNGKPATVFGIRQPDGTPGLTLDPGQRFLVDLANRSGEDAVIHWHGQTPPYVQDGVADLNRPTIPNGATVSYDYEARPGTHWMHSHHGLQEQRLMAAPLIVRSAEDRHADEQEVVVLLHDFTFRDPAELFAGLTGGTGHSGHGGGHGGGQGSAHGGHAAPNPAMGGHAMHGNAMPMDLNDVEYDAYLANDRTLDDPEVVRVERGGRVRLRIINGATSTAFHIDLGALTGAAIAVDGAPVQPVEGRRFGLTMGQRLDIRLTLPAGGGAFPVLALREGAVERTGLILATPGAAVAKLSGKASAASGPLDLLLEERLSALAPLAARKADVSLRMRLTGTMAPYVWTLDDRSFGAHAPLRVAKGQRVVLTMENASDMAHPMHLHGHHFQVVGLNGAPLAGAVRDTVLVPVKGSVTVAFDAGNPGRWPLHCHNLLHMAAGMMTEVVYDGHA